MRVVYVHANAMPQRKTPTERAAEHAQKQKELAARRMERSQPGPGAYDPKRVASSSGGSSAFKSTTDRNKRAPSSTAVPNTVGDPGAYELSGHRSLQSQATSSFQTSSRKGNGAFGGLSKRELKLANTHPASAGNDVDATPGAGTYAPMLTASGREHDMSVMNGVERMKSAAFASGTQRSGVAVPSASPGPGAYAPVFDAINPRVTHAAVSKIGRESKFTADHIDGTGDDCTTGPHVGPGSYMPMRTNGGETDSMASVSEGLRSAGLQSASMASESPQRPLAADLW